MDGSEKALRRLAGRGGLGVQLFPELLEVQSWFPCPQTPDSCDLLEQNLVPPRLAV